MNAPMKIAWIRQIDTVTGFGSTWSHVDIQVRAEEQEGRQSGRADGVALGERLGGVADGVQRVGDLATDSGRPLISVMPPALSVIGPKVSIARM